MPEKMRVNNMPQSQGPVSNSVVQQPDPYVQAKLNNVTEQNTTSNEKNLADVTDLNSRIQQLRVTLASYNQQLNDWRDKLSALQNSKGWIKETLTR